MRRVLVVDDDAAMRTLVADALGTSFDVTEAVRADQALDYLHRHRVDVVLTDVRMPGMDGVAFCSAVHTEWPDLPVIVLTGFGTMELAVRSMRAGAYDFLAKPVDLDTLELAVRRAVDHHALLSEVRELRRRGRSASYGIVGCSPPIRKMLDLVPRVARTDVSVLLRGETGTGKELLARAIHLASERSREPFVPVNCAAIPEQLVESELFGHVQGAYTDAHRPRRGLFQEAGAGTLFLDEVGELPLSIQPKLLRALQQRRIRPVGADGEVEVRCRVLSATNVDLSQAVEAKTFRSDLFYRLAVMQVDAPPLRERGTDVLMLADHFLREASERLQIDVKGLSAGAASALLAYRWPGNVRELQNAMESAIAMADTPLIQPADLPAHVRATEPSADRDDLGTLEDVERRHILRVLEATGGNKKAAAEILGLDRRTLYRKLERMDASED